MPAYPRIFYCICSREWGPEPPLVRSYPTDAKRRMFRTKNETKQENTGDDARVSLDHTIYGGSDEEIAAYGISITERRSTLGSADDFSSPINWMVTRNALISFLT